VNRIAVHQSIVHPFDPVGLVRLAERAGIDSVGLHVATTPEVETWWVKGIGAAMLRDLVAALLAARVTVLDVGRVRLGPELRVWDGQHAYARALELGVRLGAQFVTARADAGVADDPAELFAVLDELAGRYRLRPLLAVVAGTPAAAPAAAAATTVAATAPADATGTPSALKVIQTIKADQDKTLLADLNEAKVRGATLSVVVTLRHTGSKPSAWVLINDKKSGVMSYDTGETAETIKLDDQVNSAMKPGEVRTVRAVFKVPKGAKKVSITLGGVGTFDDVELQ
jgi:hypothetical protein